MNGSNAMDRIVDKNFSSEEEAPFPVDRAKHIIGYAVDEQNERIQHMETIYDHALELLEDPEKNLRKLKAYQTEIRELADYYESPLWRKDFEDDEAGNLPKDLKRGVLSEDGIYNLLEKYKELLNH